MPELTPEQKRNQAWLAVQFVQARDDGGLPFGEALDAARERHRDCTVCARLRKLDGGVDDLNAAVEHLMEATMNPARDWRRGDVQPPCVLDGIAYDDPGLRDRMRYAREQLNRGS